MPYQDTKVYYDGSHYIAIPKRSAPRHPGVRLPEELVSVVDEAQEKIKTEQGIDDVLLQEQPQEESKKPAVNRRATRRELFNELYQKLLNEPRRSRRGKLIQGMKPYFKIEEEAIEYVRYCHSEMDNQRRAIEESPFDCHSEMDGQRRTIEESRTINLRYFAYAQYDNDGHSEAYLPDGQSKNPP